MKTKGTATWHKYGTNGSKVAVGKSYPETRTICWQVTIGDGKKGTKSSRKKNIWDGRGAQNVTRLKSRQPEAKGWKWGLDQSYKQTFQVGQKTHKRSSGTCTHSPVDHIGSHWTPERTPGDCHFPISCQTPSYLGVLFRLIFCPTPLVIKTIVSC